MPIAAFFTSALEGSALAPRSTYLKSTIVPWPFFKAILPTKAPSVELMVAGAENEWSEGPVHLEAAEGVNELSGVGRAGLSDAGRERFHRQIADDGTQPRIVVVELLISSQEGLVLGRIDLRSRDSR